MSGIKTAVLDSNILIYCSKNRIRFLDIANRYDRIFVSSIVWMETLGFAFADGPEKRKIEVLLRAFETVHTDMEIVKRVIFYKQTRRIKTPDAIIFATAHKLEAELVTATKAIFEASTRRFRSFVPS